MSRLHITAEERDEVVVIFLAGHIDGNTAPVLHKFVENLEPDDQLQVVLDLHEVVYISSAGMGAILQCAQAIREKRGDLSMARANANVKKLIDLLGFGALLMLHETTDEAVAAFA